MKLFSKRMLVGSTALLMTISCAITQTFTARAAQPAFDDPGYGRLSGTDIPEEFFEDGRTGLSGLSVTPSNMYGSSQTISAFTKSTYTHQDKFDGMAIVNGIDVSQYQNVSAIDWTQVKASGIEFAFIRVGGRGYGAAGTLYNDSYYTKNVDGALAAGINVGLYIYSQATTEAEAVEEAQFILDRIGGRTITYPIVLDYEFASPKDSRLRAANLSKEAATNVCLAFCKKIQEAGYTPMVYANPDMLNNHLNADVLSGYYPIWLANYTTATTYPGTFTYWQYASNGTVPGINAKVDMNFYYVAAANNIANAIVTPIDDQIYTGAPFTPAPVVTMNGAALKNGVDYTVAFDNNINIGNAKITITGTGAYTGTKTITFRITPVPISDLAVSAKTKNSLTLSWSAVSGVDGYELYRCDRPNGDYALVKKIAGASKTSYKNTKLTEGQKYYYKIRVYKTVINDNVYGDFSNVITTYTKTSYTRLALPKTDTVIYTDMNTNSEVAGDVDANSFAKVTFKTFDDYGTTWYRVSYDGVTGYMHGGQVKIAKQGKIVKGSKINIRKKASTKSKILTTIKKNKKVAVLKTKKVKGVTWYNVMYIKNDEAKKGWISAPYVKI